jgi:hypothetical protein
MKKVILILLLFSAIVGSTPNVVVDINKFNILTFDNESLTIVNSENGGISSLRFKSKAININLCNEILSKIYFVDYSKVFLSESIFNDENTTKKTFVNVYFDFYSKEGTLPINDKELIFGKFKLILTIENNKSTSILIINDKSQEQLFFKNL